MTNYRRSFMTQALSSVKRVHNAWKAKHPKASADEVSAWANNALAEGGGGHWEFPASEKVSALDIEQEHR